MSFQALIEAARTAVETGDLEQAEQLYEKAKQLKAIEELVHVEEEDDGDNEQVVEMQAKIDEMAATIKALDEFKHQVENEPAEKAGTLVVSEDETDKKASKGWMSLGEQLKAIQVATQTPHMADDRIKAAKAIVGASESVSSDGGYLVQQDFTDELFRLMHATGAVASRVRRVPISGNSNGLKMNAVDETSRATGSRFGGVRGYWVAEGGPITASKPKFRQMELSLKKVAALVYATDELLADTAAMTSVISQAAGEELAFMVDDSIINGTGAGQPVGIMNSGALLSVAKETGQAATSLVANNIIKMWARMWAGSRANAVWFINQDIEPQLLTMDMPVGTGGVPVYLPPGGLSASPYGSLMGRPVIPIEHAQTLGTNGDILLLDLSQYIMIEKGGLNAASSIHVQFLTDQSVFRFIYRLDGQPMWSSALTPYKGSNTQSPFIALATRS